MSDQVNPAVTLSLLAMRKLDVLRAVVYMVAQCLGACLGASALYLALPLKATAEHFVNRVSFLNVLNTLHTFLLNISSVAVPPLKLTQVPIDLNAVQALCIEILCTFQMVFTIFSVEEQRRRESVEPGNLAIGFSHTAGVLLGVRERQEDSWNFFLTQMALQMYLYPVFLTFFLQLSYILSHYHPNFNGSAGILCD